MQASIQSIFTWSQNRIFAGGSPEIVLLVEWRGLSPADKQGKQSRKVVAREIELRIWLEPNVELVNVLGCKAEEEEGNSLLLRLGKIHSGQRRFAGLEFKISPMPAGRHNVLWLQWQYKQPPIERIRELPVQKLNLEYTHHTSVLRDSCNSHVEKHMALLETEELLKRAVAMRAAGQQMPAYEMICRHADKLLLLATRTGDLLMLKEAESLYKYNELELSPHDKAAGEM
ncbi:hypothetical protein GCM10010912_30640 [Paenibacillus albidus]|uniref:Uncharacterized protein n=1 Tax=Paenibacillus albidus TaxID=2041023 RepID=A0A917FJE3_9BACL|nr:hypothetical protein [Paenibacillus albidus]GGF83387.1 hypothetical protein GCM10010912_30640 [Paenibacillus albidus]